jgi:hypothetical protein
MTRVLAKNSTLRALRALSLLVAFCLLLVPPLILPQRALAGVKASDDFQRADGGLGANWQKIKDGGLKISSQAVTGRSGLTGDMWAAEKFPGNQYSQIEITPKQLKNGQWVGTAVRVQKGGLSAYVGIYDWNSGRPELKLFKRIGGIWTQLSQSYSPGPLAAGTQLKVAAVGSTITFLENGIQRLSVSDPSLSGGAPGIMIYGHGAAGSWSGGDAQPNAPFEVHYMRTAANGVKWYQVISADNGPNPQLLRVLAPTDPAPGVPHNFLYVLPVQRGLLHKYKDGLATLLKLNAQNKYNLTIVQPTFGIDPWYANNPQNPDVQYETFMAKELVPWVRKNLATTGHEQNWLIGFSKSGLGVQDLILKYPGVFTLSAAWDFPAGMYSYNQYGADPAASYGTDANFQANYRLTAAFLNSHKGPFQNQNRIWIGGNREFPAAMSGYARLLTREGIVHTTETPRPMAHDWGSGWIPIALAALRHDSINFRPGHGSLPPLGSFLPRYCWPPAVSVRVGPC